MEYFFSRFYPYRFIILPLVVFSTVYLPVLLGHFIFLPVTLLFFASISYLAFNNLRINVRDFLAFLIFLAIILPGIQISTSFPEIRPEEFVIYALFPFVFFSNINTTKLTPYSKRFTQYYILFLFLAIISTVYGLLVLNVKSGSRDIIEFVKMGKYLLIFLVASTLRPTEKDLRFLLNALLIASAISAIIGILQFYNIFGFSSLTGPIYLGDKIYKVNERLTGTFSNPNSYSVVLGFCIIISLSFLLHVKKRFLKTLYSLSLAFFFICIFLTGSRTGLAAILFSTMALLVLYLRFDLNNFKSLLPVIIILALSFVAGVYYAGQDLVSRLSSGVNLLENESLLMRVYAWYLNIQLIVQSPILGWGPGKEMFTTIVDNEYILVLRRYGVVGLSAFIMLYLYPLFISTKHYFSHKGNKYALIFTITIVFFLISNLTNSIYNHIQTMDMWFIVLGTYFGINRRIKATTKE